MASPLAHNQAHAAGGGLYQNGFAGADLMGTANEILRGQAFPNHRRSGFVVDENGSFTSRVIGLRSLANRRAVCPTRKAMLVTGRYFVDTLADGLPPRRASMPITWPNCATG